MYYVIRFRLKNGKGSTWETFPNRPFMMARVAELKADDNIAAIEYGKFDPE